MAGAIGAGHLGLERDGAPKVWALARRGSLVQSGETRPAELPSAAGSGGADASVPGIPAPCGKHGDGHGLAGDYGTCTALVRGAQGLAQPGRSRLGQGRDNELARGSPRMAKVPLQAKLSKPGKGRSLSGPGASAAELCNAADLPASRGPDLARWQEDAPPADLRPQAAWRDPRAGQRRFLGWPPARVCGLWDQPTDLL